MAYDLPPISMLRLFEAAGRHGSFKAAAAELDLTPSAVSHGIQALEGRLGTILFERDRRGLALSAAGTAYLAAVRIALDGLARAGEALPVPGAGRLSISAAPSFGLRWLVPRLADFRARHPEIAVSVDTAQHQVELTRDGVDVAIRMGRGAGGSAVRLAVEDLVPVAAPALAAAIGSPDDLAGQTLLHVSTVHEDWQAWAVLVGLAGLDLSMGQRFDTIHMALEAAVRGQGVAIGRLPLVSEDLRAGRLVAILGPPVQGRTAYWLVAGSTRPEVACFRDWIVAELAQRPA